MKAIELRAFAFIAVSAAFLVADAQELPTRFSHRLHVAELELACGDCHTQVRTSTQAADNLNPGNQTCLDCHDAEAVPSSWPTPEREYRFSHQYHVDALDLACGRCHAGIETMERTEPGGLPAMAACMACHNGTAAERDCETCHTLDRVELVPDSHRPGWSQEHGRRARITDSSCLPCHAASDCQECHDGGMLIELAGRRQSPSVPELEGSQGTILQRVHGFNYRFLHALEARGKSSDCIVCHDLDTGHFCAECHNPGRNPGIRPVWHGGADWGTLAVGSGGGRHAKLARRDLENCVACHDVQSEDPICLLCHMDRLPGRGNDPKTHTRSFVSDVGEGDFHDDHGAICFTCHVFKGPAGGGGFCGYCHGSK